MRNGRAHWGVLALIIGVALSQQTKQNDSSDSLQTTTDNYRLDQTESPTDTEYNQTSYAETDTPDILLSIQNNINMENLTTDNTEHNVLLSDILNSHNSELSTKNDSFKTVISNVGQETEHLQGQQLEQIRNGTKTNALNLNNSNAEASDNKNNQEILENSTIIIANKTDIFSNKTEVNMHIFEKKVKPFELNFTPTTNQGIDLHSIIEEDDLHSTTAKTDLHVIITDKTLDVVENKTLNENSERNSTNIETETNGSGIWDLFNEYFNNANFSESEGIEHRLSSDLFLTISGEQKEEEIFGPVQPREVEEAADYGLRKMNELINVKEPELYKQGLWVDREGPAGRVAAFSAPRPQVLTLARYGYATLQASTKLLQQLTSASGEPESRHGANRLPAELRESLRGTALHAECPVRPMPLCRPAARRYRTADGTCNNALHARRGAALTPQQRFLPPRYNDGIQTIRPSVVLKTPLPSARLVSTRVHRDRYVEAPSVTLMLMQWGQFIDHDIISTPQARAFNGSTPRCCTAGGQDFQPPDSMHPECLPIPVPTDDWFLSRFNMRCIEFIRSAPTPREECDFGYRQQLNQVTSYIDASTIYGSSVQQSDAMRLFRDGLLQYGRLDNRNPPDPPGGELCRDGAITTECYRPGDARSGEQPALTALHITWLRKHNQLAERLALLNKHWTDEKIFQETRRIIGAMIQHITYREFLPIILGQEVMKLFDLQLLPKGYYTNYDPKVNPTPANSFTAAAYRFGHSLVQNSFSRSNKFHRPLFNNVSLHEEQENPENIWSFGSVDRLLLGLCNQPSQRRDEFFSDELTNHLFQPPGFPFGMDLASINIQRGRDHGLAPYTTWRAPCGLTPIKNWTDLQRVMSKETAQRFRSIYLSVDDIDLFSAGLAEKPVRGGIVGPTFACIIAQQFLNLRKGDRFWYENGNIESSFTPAQLQQIRQITFAQILCETMPEVNTLQPFVLLTPDSFKNQRQSCRDLTSFDLNPWIEKQPELNSTGNGSRFKRTERKQKRPNRRKTKPKPHTTQTRNKTNTDMTNDASLTGTKTKQITYFGTNKVTINHKPDGTPYYHTTKPNNYYEYAVTNRPTLNNDFYQDELTLDMPNKRPNTPNYLFSTVQKQKPSTTTPDYKLHIQINYYYNTTEKPNLIIEKPGHHVDINRLKPNRRPVTDHSYHGQTTFNYNQPTHYNTETQFQSTYNHFNDRNTNSHNSKPLYYDVITNNRPGNDFYNLNNAQTYGLNFNKYPTKYPHNVATSNPITILDTKPPIHLKPQTVSTKRPNIYIIDTDHSYIHTSTNTDKYRPQNFDYIRPAQSETHVYRRPISAHITKLNTKPVVVFARPQLSKLETDYDTTELKYDDKFMNYPADREPFDATLINIDHTIDLLNNTKYIQILTAYANTSVARPTDNDKIYIPVSKVKGYTTSTNSLDRVYVNVQQKEGDDNLEMTDDDLLEIYTKPQKGSSREDNSDIENRNNWKIYNETTDNHLYSMPEPSFNREICSIELPKPMDLFIDDGFLIF